MPSKRSFQCIATALFFMTSVVADVCVAQEVAPHDPNVAAQVATASCYRPKFRKTNGDVSWLVKECNIGKAKYFQIERLHAKQDKQTAEVFDMDATNLTDVDIHLVQPASLVVNLMLAHGGRFWLFHPQKEGSALSKFHQEYMSGSETTIKFRHKGGKIVGSTEYDEFVFSFDHRGALQMSRQIKREELRR